MKDILAADEEAISKGIINEIDSCTLMAHHGASINENYDKQLYEYEKIGFPRHFGLYENSIIVRKHKDKMLKKIMNDWWNEYNKYPTRDQFSLPFVIWKNHYSSIQLLKLMSSLIYLFRPIYLRIYINRHYVINRKISYDEEPIKQKWNGVAQHVCSVVLDSTDNIVLTIFATLSDVSIYSVYYLVVSGVKQLFLSLTNGIQSLIGELWAKQELDNLKKYFEWIEWSIHTGVVFIFGYLCG